MPCCCCCCVASVVSDSVRPLRRQPTRLPRPWDSPSRNTGVGCHFLLQCMKEQSGSEVAQLCPTLSDPMDCSLPGSSVHGIFQARVLEWGAIAFSRHMPWEYHNSKGHMYPSVHCSTIYNSQDIEATEMSNNTSVNKEDLKLLRLILFQPRLAAQ